jgi:hypothetical protein
MSAACLRASLIGFKARIYGDYRPVAMDRGKSQGRARHEFRSVGVFGKFPDRDVVIASKDGARQEKAAH